MNILIHFLFNILFGEIFRFKWEEILLIGLGGVIIDLDHILYQFFIVKNRTIKQMWEWHKRESKINRPHYYVFHYLEIMLIITILGYFFNWYLFLIFLGFILHWIVDAIMYINYYKSLNPWIKYYSLIGTITR